MRHGRGMKRGEGAGQCNATRNKTTSVSAENPSRSMRQSRRRAVEPASSLGAVRLFSLTPPRVSPELSSSPCRCLSPSLSPLAPHHCPTLPFLLPELDKLPFNPRRRQPPPAHRVHRQEMTEVTSHLARFSFRHCGSDARIGFGRPFGHFVLRPSLRTKHLRTPPSSDATSPRNQLTSSAVLH
jgi:hypothetical protein